MSAIGNYIHLTQEGYLKHGTTKNGNYSKWRSQRSKIIKRASKIKRHDNLKQIEEWTQSIMSKNELDNSRIAEIQAEIKRQLDEAFENEIKEIDFEHGKVQSMETKSGQTISTIKIANKNFKDKIANITKRINQLEEIGLKLLADGELKENEVLLLENQLQTLKKAYKDVFESTNRQITAWGYKQKKGATVNEDKITDLKKIANQMIEAYAKYPAVFLQEGTLFEHALAAAPYVADAAAYEAIEEVITKGNTGADYIMQDFNFHAFDKRMHKKLSDTVQVDTDVATGRKKVDVEVKWREDGEVKKMTISAKNIEIKNNTYKHITTVTGSPLLTMIQTLDPDFINHYINVYSRHYQKVQTKRGEEYKQISLASDIEDKPLINELKLALFYISITGDNFGRKEDIAEVFAINDKGGRGVKLIPMADIIYAIKDMTKNISVKYSASGASGVSIGDYRFNQKWEPDIQTRLNNLVMELHKAKVKVSFNMMGVIKM